MSSEVHPWAWRAAAIRLAACSAIGVIFAIDRTRAGGGRRRCIDDRCAGRAGLDGRVGASGAGQES